jgi:superfamily II DNA or RNA helicase
MDDLSLENFFPKYPNIHETEHQILDPYPGQNFYETIFKKKEFYENRLSKTEKIPNVRGGQMKNQITLARYMSSNTMFDELLVVHDMGTGKSCTAIGAVEIIKKENSSIDGAYIFARGTGLLKNFMNEVTNKCTGGEYIPDASTQGEMAHRVKLLTRFYQPRTFATFASSIAKLPDKIIIDKYSNKILIIDEVHNIRIQNKKDKSKIDTYKEFHRFLHLVKNCKILLLSGTPMKDTSEEIASVMNLILPLDMQLPEGNTFIKEYLEIAPDTDADAEVKQYVVKDDMKDNLKRHFKGRVSFLNSMRSSVKTVYRGEKLRGLQKFNVSEDIMSDHQTQGYFNATNEKTKGSVVDLKPRQASLFVYPDGSYGADGFEKWITSKDSGSFSTDSDGKKVKLSRYLLSKGLANTLKGENDEETLTNIGKYSSKYKAVIKRVLKNQKSGKTTFVYGWFVKGSGLILFSLLLRLFGMSSASGDEKGSGSRYAILTNETANDNQKVKIIDRFNRSDNMRGGIISVIIGSSAISEGFSLLNIQEIDVLTPHWNFSEIAQAIARGIRLGSHRLLIEAKLNPIVNIYLCISSPNDGERSIDLSMYLRSEIKDLSMQFIMRLLKESAFDCGLNYFRNHSNGEDGSRECEYMSCDYKCDGIEMSDITKGIPKEDLDFSTYQLYYVDPAQKRMMEKIGSFLEHQDSTLENIVAEFAPADKKKVKPGEYSEFTIRIVLSDLLKTYEDDVNPTISFKNFNKIYTRTVLQHITDELEILFKTKFSLDFVTLSKNFPEHTTLELTMTLSKIINQSVRITNMYGFASYLKEQNNVFFLVGSLSDVNMFTSNYYTKIPNVLTTKPYDITIGDLYVPKAVEYICSKYINSQTRKKILSTLSPVVQEIILEAAVKAQDGEVNLKRDDILEYFDIFLKEVDGYKVSTFIHSKGGSYRCLDINTGVWDDCSSTISKDIKTARKDKIETLVKNTYGYYGIENPETGTFCIRNLVKEMAKQQKLNSDKPFDPRNKFPGQDCGTWDQPLLYKLLLTVFKIDPPDEYDPKMDKVKMIAHLKNSKYNISNKVGANGGKKKQSLEIFQWKGDKLSLEDADGIWRKATDDEILRAVYWTKIARASKKKIVTMCTVLREWFKKKGLYAFHSNCGIQGKDRMDD